MRDPYLYTDVDVLRNKLNIKNQEELNNAETDFSGIRLYELSMYPLDGNYNFKHLCDFHKYIFQDIDEVEALVSDEIIKAVDKEFPLRNFQDKKAVISAAISEIKISDVFVKINWKF